MRISEHPPSSKNRSELTRQALLDSATRLFGKHGFDATSNRLLAEHAGVNQALIGYHFGSKEGLYEAVFEHIAERLSSHLAPVLLPIESELQALTGGERDTAKSDVKKRCVNAISTLLENYVCIINFPEFEDSARVIVREQLDPSNAFEIMWNKVMHKYMTALTLFICLSKGRTAPDQSDRLMSITLMGQVLVFRVARASINRHMQWEEPHGADNLEKIQLLIRSNIKKILD